MRFHLIAHISVCVSIFSFCPRWNAAAKTRNRTCIFGLGRDASKLNQVWCKPFFFFFHMALYSLSPSAASGDAPYNCTASEITFKLFINTQGAWEFFQAYVTLFAQLKDTKADMFTIWLLLHIIHDMVHSCSLLWTQLIGTFYFDHKTLCVWFLMSSKEDRWG